MNTPFEERIGRIFDIQRYSIHDGPGIRTIVFLKGCALRCRWCCNPESQSYDIESMRLDKKTKTIGRDVTAREVLAEVVKDIPYYRRSGGGLTLSGGECLLQADFSEALLSLAKSAGISTAVESTGFGPFAAIQAQILPHLDVFLMDIKHMDTAKHREFTGQPNAPLLENALRIAQTGQSLVIRVPVVPGFNSTEQEIANIARYTATLPGVKQLHLLPFHRLGENKYTGLGRPYAYAATVPPAPAHMEQLRAAACAAAPGLHVQMGG